MVTVKNSVRRQNWKRRRLRFGGSEIGGSASIAPLSIGIGSGGKGFRGGAPLLPKTFLHLVAEFRPLLCRPSPVWPIGHVENGSNLRRGQVSHL
jgi:hypothetical protein